MYGVNSFLHWFKSQWQLMNWNLMDSSLMTSWCDCGTSMHTMHIVHGHALHWYRSLPSWHRKQNWQMLAGTMTANCKLTNALCPALTAIVCLAWAETPASKSVGHWWGGMWMLFFLTALSCAALRLRHWGHKGILLQGAVPPVVFLAVCLVCVMDVKL